MPVVGTERREAVVVVAVEEEEEAELDDVAEVGGAVMVL